MIGNRQDRPRSGERVPPRAAAGVLVALLLSGCTGDSERRAQGPPSPAASPSPSPSLSASPSAASPAPSTSASPATPTASAAPPGAVSPSVLAAQPTVPARPVVRLPPVPLAEGEGSKEAAEAGPLRIDVVDTAPVVSAGVGPGQVQGEPAVAFTVRWSNTGATAVPLGTVVVDLSYGDGTPASPVDGPPSRPVSGSVPPGGSVTGVYVFAVPGDEREQVQLTVSEGPALPTAVFVGPVP